MCEVTGVEGALSGSTGKLNNGTHRMLRLTAYCDGSGALCLTRTKGLKVEPEDGVGDDR